MLRFLATLLFYIFRVFPINKNKIVVSSFDGKGYGDNGKAIVDELLNRNDKIDIVWLCDEKDAVFPVGVRTVKFASIRSVYEQVTARIWIDNKRKHSYVRKRKGQYYIAVCHGNTGLKKVEMDVADKLPPIYIKGAIADSKMADLFLASSKFDTKIYRSAYRYYGEVLEAGFPRQDVLLRNNLEDCAEIKKKMGIPANTQVILYAPTFRSSLTDMDLSVYRIEWERVLPALERRFQGKWKVIIRLHPNISKIKEQLGFSKDIIDATDYPDFEELLMISSILVSDYSSTLIEAGIARKIGLIFAIDLDDYRKDRDFYIPLEEFPFPVAEDNDELIKNILDFDNERYQKNLSFFLDETYGFLGSSNSSKTVADRIMSIISE